MFLLNFLLGTASVILTSLSKKCFAIVYIPILQICIWQLTAATNIHPHLCAHTHAHTHHITVMTIPYVLLLRQKATTVIIKQNVTSAVTLLKPLAKLIIEQRSNSQTLLLSDTTTHTYTHPQKPTDNSDSQFKCISARRRITPQNLYYGYELSEWR